MLTRSLLRAAAAACAAAIPSLAAAQTTTLTYDLAQSFFTYNAAGGPTAAAPFVAGTTTSYLGALTPYTDRAVRTYPNTTGQVLNTLNSGGQLVPGVFLAGANGYTEPGFTPTFGPNVLGLHPGTGDVMSTIRFYAPVTGLYTYTFTNYGLDATGNTSSDFELAYPDEDYGVLMDGGTVRGFGYAESGQSFSGGFYLAAGQFVDFSLGNDGDYAYDMTALDAQLSVDVEDVGGTVTPEPATFALVGAGVLALGAAARRRRSA